MYLSLVRIIFGTIYQFAPGCHVDSLLPFNMYNIYISFNLLPFNKHVLTSFSPLPFNMYDIHTYFSLLQFNKHDSYKSFCLFLFNT
jgi:hypothetical protein